MEKKLKPTIWVLTAVPFIMVLGNSMLIPVLPAIQEELEINLLHAGLLITAFSIPAGIFIPLAGIISDHIGRKKVMAPALVVYGIGGILAGLAAVLIEKPYPYILGARIIQGLGAGGTYQLAMALAGDLIKGKERAAVLGLLEAGNGLGKVISPLVGATVGLISWYMPFFVYGVLAIPVAALVYWVAKEPANSKKAQSTGEYLKNLASIFKQKGVNLSMAFLCGMLVLFSLFGLLSFLSDLLEKTYHFKVFSRGLIIAVPVLVMAISAYILGTVLKAHLARILKWTILGGLLMVGTGLFLFPLVNGVVFKVGVSTLIGLGTGAVLPSLNTLITSSAPTSERGLVTCLYGTVRFFGVAIGPPLFGLIDHYGQAPIFWVTAALILLAFLLTFFLINPQKVLPQQMQEGN
ncbi:MAG TPA: MFS transporter [Firmicutes bacterium]|nr:MFS transporter [Bacillota bacterium]